jgi:hypothetical protein
MKRAKTIVLLSVVLLCPQAAFAQADAEPTDLDPRLLAKMAKVRAKQGVEENKRDGDGDEGGGRGALPNCAVNIGNSVNAPRGNAPKEIAVFIKGDVILSNNKCK